MGNQNSDDTSKALGLIYKIIFGIFSLIMVYLTLLSLFSSCYLGIFVFDDGEVNKEHTFWVSDNLILLIAISILVLLIISIINKRWAVPKGKFVKLIFAIFVLAVGLSFLILTGLEPRDDQLEVMNIAAQMRKGDFSAFMRTGYLSLCPHQAGLTLYFYLLSFIFGVNNYFSIQVLNLFYLLGIYFLLSKLSKLIFINAKKNDNKLVETLTFISSILFLPLFFYISFVYGTLPGLFFSLLSIIFELHFISSKRIVYAIGASISISIAIQLKSNYEIFFIAILMIAVFEGIVCFKRKERVIPYVIFCIMLMVMFFIGKILVFTVLYAITGYTLGKGAPAIAYVAMGIQEGKAGPGWWNFYNLGVYVNNDFDYDKTTKEVIGDIQKQIRIFGRDFKYTAGFFIRKIASMWNNPTFEGFDILKWRISSNVNCLSNSLIYGPLSRGLTYYLNILHTLILSGVCYWIAGKNKRIETRELVLPMIIIGGFVFHLFWEAKCQYILPYFILLLPYSAEGYQIAGEWICKHLEKFKSNKESRKKYYVGFFIGILSVLVLNGLSKTEIFHDVLSLNSNEVYYEEYLYEQKNMTYEKH